MKTRTYTLLDSVISSLAVLLCFVPFLFLGFKQVRKVNTYKVIGVYWFLNGFVNLPALRLIRSQSVRSFFAHVSDYYDMADTPLVLLVFALASRGKTRKQLLLILLGFLGCELLFVANKGYAAAWPVVIGIGVLLILVFSVIGLLQYLKKMEPDRFDDSMAFVYAALLFAYGTYMIIYLVYYLRVSPNIYNQMDSSLVYYSGLLLSAIFTSAGIWNYGRRRNGKSRFLHYSSSSS
jgi:hypothetical protein